MPASPEKIFSYVDDHRKFSIHMSKPSWVMGGGKMAVQTDEGHGQRVGSHMRLNGKVFGINLFLDEVVTKREPPYVKTWESVGNLNLLVIGNYRMGLMIKPEGGGSVFRVLIDYELPGTAKTRWLGFLFGKLYAKWCVRQMLKDTGRYFAK